MRNELASIAIRMEAWQRELRAIQQQHQHDWTLEGITLKDADAAIEAARAVADELRGTANQIESQVEQATKMLGTTHEQA